MLHSIPAGIASFPSGYTIERALLFNGTNGFLSRTPSGAATSARIFTMSVWLKRAEITDSTYDGYIFVCSPDEDGIALTQDDDKLAFRIEGSTYVMTAANQFRDPTAWFHLILRIDSTQAVAANRIRIYINGTQLTLSGTPPDQNYDYTRWLVASKIQRIGFNGFTQKYFNGYMAEFAMYDGTSLGPDSFGETSEDSGIWVPIKIPSSGFGNNGFHLEFKQTGTSQNSSGIGADTSGATNHFAVNNLVAADQIEDSPSNDANNNIGNYATYNPLDVHPSYVPTFSNGNLTATGNSGNVYSQCRGTIGISSGKFVIQITPGSTLSNGALLGVIRASDLQNAPSSATGTKGILCRSDNGGQIYNDGTAAQSSLGTWDNGNDMRVEVNADDGTVAFFKDGSAYGSAVSSITFDEPWVFTWMPFNAYAATLEHSIAAMDGTVTSGFKEWNTANLTAPAVTKPVEQFKTIIYEGTGSALKTGQSGVPELGFTPDMVWIKDRDETDSHALFNSVIGVQNYFQMNNAGNMQTSSSGITAFSSTEETDTSHGFTIGGDLNPINSSGDSMVAWCFKAGGAPTADNSGGQTPTSGSRMDGGSVSTTNYSTQTTAGGTIKYPIRMSTASHGGFSIFTFNGGSGPSCIPHGLSTSLPGGGRPEMLILNNVSGDAGGGTISRPVFHIGTHPTTPWLRYLQLQISDGHNTLGDAGTWAWDEKQPGTETVTIGTGGAFNDAGDVICAMAFARVPGLIGIGSYTGNNSADGPNVVIDDGGSGFKPAWIMLKKFDVSGNWFIKDNARNTHNPVNLEVYANSTDADYSDGNSNVDFIANGFKIKGAAGGYNSSGHTITYLAFAESPFALNNRAR